MWKSRHKIGVIMIIPETSHLQMTNLVVTDPISQRIFQQRIFKKNDNNCSQTTQRRQKDEWIKEVNTRWENKI